MTADSDELRRQQQRVMAFMAEVGEALRSDASPTLLGPLLGTLSEHLESVFDAEEAAMKAYRFPTSELHHLDHAWLRTVLGELHSSMQESAHTQEARDKFADRFERYFSTLMADHVETHDQELSVFLKNVCHVVDGLTTPANSAMDESEQ